MRKTLSAISIATAIALGAPANAAETIWLDSDHSSYSGYYASGAGLGFAGGGVNATASAWSIGTDGKIRAAQLGIWNQGLGVKNGSGDNSHTIDNKGYLDFVLLQFDKIVKLETARLTTGWHGMKDTDATIGYTVLAAPSLTPLALSGQLQSSLSSYNLYGSGSVGNSGTSTRNINPDNKVGNVWLIGASFKNPEGSTKLDGFKLEKLTFTVSAVPEPGTWMMMLLGIGAIGGAMRSRRKRTVLASLA